uniref:Uncharacterized protein n=1 Tax=Ananas comosus var. bracteatus TaxID=296719 RepID=A0A6V7Q8Z8_ANACO|nr:unnamed protein product [Ananas comosus var. bracteatus]
MWPRRGFRWRSVSGQKGTGGGEGIGAGGILRLGDNFVRRNKALRDGSSLPRRKRLGTAGRELLRASFLRGRFDRWSSSRRAQNPTPRLCHLGGEMGVRNRNHSFLSGYDRATKASRRITPTTINQIETHDKRVDVLPGPKVHRDTIYECKPALHVYPQLYKCNQRNTINKR